jgi:acetoin utilization protein AcuC
MASACKASSIAWLLRQGAERIAYVDIEAHHGDGVQAAFWDDPRVLTISLHQHSAMLVLFTGLPTETGGPAAEGSAVNVALPAGIKDARWLRPTDAAPGTRPPRIGALPPRMPASGLFRRRRGIDAVVERRRIGQRPSHVARSQWPGSVRK